MRWVTLAVILASVSFTSNEARAQPPQDSRGPRFVPPGQPGAFRPPPPILVDRRVAQLMNRLRDEMWAYRQELEFFRRVPEYNKLVDLRYQLRNFAIEMAEAREFNQDVRAHARQMERAAQELYHLSEHLEDRMDGRTNPDVRRRADALHERAVEIRVLVGRLHEAIHLDLDTSPPYVEYRIKDDGR